MELTFCSHKPRIRVRYGYPIKGVRVFAFCECQTDKDSHDIEMEQVDKQDRASRSSQHSLLRTLKGDPQCVRYNENCTRVVLKEGTCVLTLPERD